MTQYSNKESRIEAVVHYYTNHKTCRYLSSEALHNTYRLLFPYVTVQTTVFISFCVSELNTIMQKKSTIAGLLGDPQAESSSSARSHEQILQSLMFNGFDDYDDEDEDEEEEEDSTYADPDIMNADDVAIDLEEEAGLPSWMRGEDYIDDDEITQVNLLQRTKEARERLKTGGLEEISRDVEEFEDNLVATAGIGKSRRKGKRRVTAGESKLTEEVKNILGRANALYIAQDYGQAIDLLQTLITQHPNVYQGWNTLGLVHEEMGNTEKALQLRMVAAHMCQNDGALWKELGLKSVENNATQQAIYCLSKALIVDPTDVDALWDRSFLFKKLGRTDDAIDGFMTILEYMPHHFKVINELAQLYRLKGQIKESITLYENAMEYHIKNVRYDEEEEEEGEDDEFSDKLGYAEINMLSELYLMQNDYRRALECIKTGLRHVQKRQDQTWWIDRVDDDDEYFEDDEERSEFPIELRVRMGVCRVYLGQVDVATKHFNYLLQYPATTYPDLHQDIAYAYMDKRHYDLALSVFQKVIDVSDEVEVDVLIRTADCYREVGELKTAAIFYVNVLDGQPDNLDVMMSLAMVYEEQGKEEQALELVDFVMQKHREARRQKKESTANAKKSEDTPEKPKRDRTKKASLFDEAQKASEAERRRQQQLERMRNESEKELHVQTLFAKIFELEETMGPNIVGMDRTVMREYMRVAQELWDDFRNTRAFYPALRSTKYEGFYAIRSKRQREPLLELEAHHMALRLRGRMNKAEQKEEELDEHQQEMKEEEERQMQMSAADHFRQVTFDIWHRTFIKYAYMLATTRRAEEGYNLLKRAIEANVFYHDISKKTSLKLALLGCGLINGNEEVIGEAIRWLCNFYQFRNDPYRIYGAVMSSTMRMAENYASQNSMKYIIRTIRLMDAIVARNRSNAGEDVDVEELERIKELHGAILAMNIGASDTNELNYSRFYHVPKHLEEKTTTSSMSLQSPTQTNPVLLNLFGNILNIGRNYHAATVFYMRAYAIAPDDPLNTLSMGISFLLRSMQRKSDNRHLQVTQGMMFLQEYASMRGQSQEVEYNLGRAFHLLARKSNGRHAGLTHLAVRHYERVLLMSSSAKRGTVPEGSVEDVYTWPDDDIDEEDDDETDLKREAAYNLHLIYMTSGSPNLAQILLRKYCTV
ncbi:transcription factor TFIIIC subunit tfc4 [Apophysomyces ossiformis]|uniref:Transcription factor TFIIIC subunit tfc4 n=1 Tax=Apophysomyces ossiformis TaxID=679940 RepID=A0A8H7BTS4_9FUNG|nr:transcription factor TFIIIC subunit tfc4 [Apophysomyces ossiformis]